MWSTGPAARPPVIEWQQAGIWHVTFTAEAPTAESVYLAGDFNHWSPTATRMIDPDGDGVFVAIMALGQGAHPYKFVLNGDEWVRDNSNPFNDGSQYGNSMVFVGVEPGISAPRVESPPNWIPMVVQLNPTPRDNPNSEFTLIDAGYDEVFISGDFNNWTGQRDALTLEGDTWRIALRQPTDPWGTRYRFVVREGEEWRSITDPGTPWITFDGHPIDSIAFSAERPYAATMRLTDNLTPMFASVEARPIYAWVPPGYFTETDRDYPLLIMHDGQNVFDDPFNPFGHGGWYTNYAAMQLIDEGRIEPFVIVAVPNTIRRMSEYGSGEDILDPEGNEYIRYLIEDVLPLAEDNLRVKTGPENTSLMGSSMGGLISLYGAYHHPDIFGSAACLSTAFMITDAQGASSEAMVEQGGHQPIRLYLDSGTAGPAKDGAPLTRHMRDVLVENGWTLGEDLLWHEEPGAAHNERAWRDRVGRPLEFLYGVNR